MVPVPEVTAEPVSVENEVPEDLFAAMRSFLATHPQWDQRRLMQVALSGFLFQQGCKEPGVLLHRQRLSCTGDHKKAPHVGAP